MIAGGTVGSLGAVLSITPPSFLTNESAVPLGTQAAALTTTDTQQSAPQQSAAPAASKSATTAQTTKKATTATKKASAQSTTSTKSAAATTTQSATPSASASASATPTQTPTQAAKAASSGTFTGATSYVGPYGGVTVKITVSNGKITDVQADAPGGRNQRYTDMSVPVLRQRVIAAQGSNINGVSGASYTSYNFWMSLKSALSKAGLA